MLKKIILGLVVVGALLIAGSLFIGSNLDPIIKAAIEKYGTAATKAETTVSSVSISLSSGEGSISGLKLGNPEGFKTDSAIKIGKVSIKVDPKSILGDGPIVINEIRIEQPEVTYEVAANGSSNLQTIQRNAMAFKGQFADDETKTKAENKSEPEKEARKIVIDKLVIEGGEASLSHEMLKGKNLAAVKIPTVEMTNIGKEKGGVSALAVTKLILNQLTTSAMAVAKDDLVKELRDQGINSLKGAVEESEIGKTVGGAVKGLLGK